MIEHTMTFQPDTLYEDLKSANDVAQLLKKTRSDLGITIAKAAGETKIRKVWLNAIETGDFNKLPGTVYAIGFSRTYATYLELDSDIIVKTLQTSSDFFQQNREVLSLPQDDDERILTPKVTVVASLVLVCSIIFAFSYFMKKDMLIEDNKTSEIPSGPQAQSSELDDDLTD